MSDTIRIGDTVTVYEDPYTRERVEGLAEIVRVIAEPTDYDVGRYEVRFTSEPDETYERRIMQGAVS